MQGRLGDGNESVMSTRDVERGAITGLISLASRRSSLEVMHRTAQHTRIVSLHIKRNEGFFLYNDL